MSGDRERFTGVVVPRFWRELRPLSLAVRGLAAYLITGPHNAQVPGLAVVGVGTIADELDIDMPTMRDLWKQLPRGFAEYDPTVRVLRVANVPLHGHRPNHHLLMSWWRAWKGIPDCALKLSHVESIRCVVETSEAGAVYDTWQKTFGSVVFNHTPNHSGYGTPYHGVNVNGSVSGSGSPEGTLPLLPSGSESDTLPPPAALVLTPPGAPQPYQAPRKEHPRAVARRELGAYLEWFNRKFSTRFGEREEFLKSITTCLDDKHKYTQADLRAVAINRRDAWAGTDKAEYLTPATLLRPSCMDKYIDVAREKLGLNEEDDHAA